MGKIARGWAWQRGKDAFYPRHTFGDMIGREELSRVLIALIAVHEQFAEIIVEFTVVVHDGREQGEEIGKEFDNQFLFIGFVSVGDLQIPLFALMKL